MNPKGLRVLGASRMSALMLPMLALVLVAVAMLASAYLNHPPMRTGAPGEGTCQNCHGSYALNYGEGSIMVMGIPETYEPSCTYTLNASVYSPGMDRWCFELTVKPVVPGHPTGSYTLCDSRGTCISEDQKYIMSSRYGCGNAVNGTRCWEFMWTAPSRAESDLVFYAVGMGEDGGGTGGDCVYTCMMTSLAPPRVPDRPAGLLAEPGDGCVKLTWWMPEWCPEGWTYSSYRIYWSDQSTGGLRMLTELNGTSYEHTGLTNGHAYRYQVVGVNRMGEGQLSEMVSCAPANVPMAPRALEAEVGTGGSVRLYWQDPTAWGSGSGRYYTVLRGEHPWEMAVVEQELSSPSWVDTTIPRHNLTYHYMVRCRTSAGDGQVAMVCMDVPPAAPAAPASVEATAMSGRVEVTWQPPAEDGGDAVRHYNLYRTVAGGVPQLLAERLSVMCYNDTSCLYGTAYSYSVTAANAAGEGTMSTPVEAQMALPATELEGVDLDLGDIPLPALGAVAAVIIIGAVMVGRLGLRSRGRTRGDE